LSSPQLDATNKFVRAKDLEQSSDTLAYQRQLLASHSSANVVEGQSSDLGEPQPQSQLSISHQNSPLHLGPKSGLVPLPQQLRNPARLIVAVDFGTTQTALGWAFVGKEGAKKDIFTSWPGSNSSKQTVTFPTSIHLNYPANVMPRFRLCFIMISIRKWSAGGLI